MSVVVEDALEASNGIEISNDETETVVGIYTGDNLPEVDAPDAPLGSQFIRTSGEKYTRHTFTSVGEATDWSQDNVLAGLRDLDTSVADDLTPFIIKQDVGGNFSLVRETAAISTNDNKIINGFCERGDKFNWHNDSYTGLAIFRPDDSHLGQASVSFQNTVASGRQLVLSDFPIRVNPHATYRMEVSAKFKRPGIGTVIVGSPGSFDAGSFIGLIQYDAEGNQIFPYYNMYHEGSLSTLIADYTPGDTFMDVDNVDGWDFNTVDIWERGFIAWNYVDTFGQAFQPHTYSRNYAYNIFDTGTTVTPITGGFRITLTGNQPGFWPFGMVATAGTQISQGDSGGTYKYIVAANNTFGGANNPDWTRRFGYIGKQDLSGTNRTHNFSPGTAFIRMLTLPLWTNSYDTDELHLSSIYLHEESSVSSEIIITSNPSSGNDGTSYNHYKPVASSTGVVSTQVASGTVT